MIEPNQLANANYLHDVWIGDVKTDGAMNELDDKE